MKLKKSRALLLSLMAILFAATTADTFAQLTKIWDRSNNNFALERLCRPGKLAVVSLDGINQFLIDLTNGETIHSTIFPESLYTNYWGDRYYIFNVEENIRKEYDVKTKEFIKIAKLRIQMPDSSIFGYNENHNSLLFYNANSGELLDSFKVPGSPDEPIYTLTRGQHFSYDGRFYAFHLQLKNKPTQNHFFLYDRQAREIIMRKDLPANNDLLMQFFNQSNLMAYSEEVKLEGDDKAYSYIRIYDPDKREVVKNIKMSDDNILHASFITLRQDDKYFAHGTGKNNDVHFYDLVKNSKLDFYLPTFPGPLYLDDSLYIAGSYRGYKIDWNAVSVEEEPNPNIPVIYPNPSTNSVTFEFILPISGITKIQLYDLSGRVVKNVGNEFLDAGNHNYEIDISDLPNGQYNLTIETSTGITSHKILVSR